MLVSGAATLIKLYVHFRNGGQGGIGWGTSSSPTVALRRGVNMRWDKKAFKRAGFGGCVLALSGVLWLAAAHATPQPATPGNGGEDAQQSGNAAANDQSVRQAEQAGARALAILRLAAAGNQQAIDYLKRIIAHGEEAQKKSAAPAQPAEPNGGAD